MTAMVTERFRLSDETRANLSSRPVPWGFGMLSEAVFYRTYSRSLNGRQERWADTVIRVVEGVMSIRKDWYRKMGLRWSDGFWSEIANAMADGIFEMRFLPPGRGLWAMGTDFVYERGSAALSNCGFVDVTNSLSYAAEWAMTMLMYGVGVGFSTHRFLGLKGLRHPRPNCFETFTIPDSREGWAESVRLLLDSYMPIAMRRKSILFDYSNIRPAGKALRGFGGVASGADPLRKLHQRLDTILSGYTRLHGASPSKLIVDTMNAIGACVVAGNIRRSAEIALGQIEDQDFLSLKDYVRNPERREIGWLSNNSVVLEGGEDFDRLDTIADRIRDNGEPGIVNLINIGKYGRIGKKSSDKASGINPCGEIPLESMELCNLVEVFPTRCRSTVELFRAIEFATLYASTVALLPTHSMDTNAVISRNRRIGVSVSGIADWLDATSWGVVTRTLREGYEEHVAPINARWAKDAGVPASVRLTTVKPSGTVSLLAGVSPGMHWPIHRHCIRRMRIGRDSPISWRLSKAGVPFTVDPDSDGTVVFDFPLAAGNGHTRPVSEVSVWEQASLVAMLSREWADNAVSNTLTFSPSKEGHQIERVLACFAPIVKSLSLLPDQGEQKSYGLAPYERIDEAEFKLRSATIRPVDWGSLGGTDGADSRFCDSDVCDVPV